MKLNEQIKRIKTIMFLSEQDPKDDTQSHNDQVKLPKKKLVNYCKDKRDLIHQVYNDAKSWWYDWLKSEQSKTNFAKDFNLTPEKTDKVFLWMERVIKSANLWFSRAGLDNAYAETSCRTTLFCDIFLDCTREFDPDLHYSVFVHELQHALNYSLKNGKHQIDFSSKMNNLFNEDVNSVNEKDFTEKAKKIGLDENTIQRMLRAITFFKKNPEEKILTSDEMLSRIYATRAILNINYPEKFTLQNLIDNVENTNVYYILIAILMTLKIGDDFENKIQELLDVMNSVAKNEQPQNLEIKTEYLPSEVRNKISNLA